MQRALIGLLRWVPLRVMYGFAFVTIPVYLLNGQARSASYRFFHKRMGYGCLRSALHVYRNMYNLGKVVMDRFAVYAGQPFGIVSEDFNVYYKLTLQEGPVIMLSSHVGNYEMAGYMLRSSRASKVLVYAGETATIMQNRARVFSDTLVEMVPVSEDMSHIFTLNNALADGEIVSLPADRLFGSPKAVSVPFFGENADFPAGPFTLSVQRDVPVLVPFVMKIGVNLYKVIIKRLELPKEGTRQEKVQALAAAYAQVLETVVREYPDQWYNFFDFWHHETL